MNEAKPKPLLDVVDLHTRFSTNGNTVYAVNGVSFRVHQGEVLGIVGESGCGKSVTALSIMRLVSEPGRIVRGKVLLHEDGTPRDLLTLSNAEMERIRGNTISMIFQDPMTSLNPVLTIGYQIAEPLRLHRHMPSHQAYAYAAQLLERVGIPEAERRLNDFPHQFSGGMRQRVMVAMAIACRPRLLIADEPTTALDVTIQAQILDLIRELKSEIDTSVIIISHDLGVIAELADQVAVMYAGTIVESGPVRAIFDAPRHPYTRALLAAVPRLRTKPDRLTTIEGAPPNLLDEPVGCAFEPRCRYRIPRCAVEQPAIVEGSPGHRFACWVAQEGRLSRD